MNLDELDAQLEPTTSSKEVKLLGPAPRPTASGFVPMTFPSHMAIVQDEETGRVERVALPLILTNRDVVRRIPVDAHLGGVEL